MTKKIFFVFLFITTIGFSQNTIKGILKPAKDYKWMIAYKLNGSKQDFVVYDTLKQGEFSLKLPQNSKKGVYRLFYDVKNRMYVDVFYDNEDIELSINTPFPNSAVFLKSKNNILYDKYIKAISSIEAKLDSLQINYFALGASVKTEKVYQKQLQLLNATQEQFEKQSTGLLVEDFIKSSKKFYNKTLFKEPKDYLASVNAHFYDYVDFNSKALSNSTFLHDKINQYIFRINNSDDATTLRKLRKTAINTTLEKIKTNPLFSQDIQEGLLYNFAQIQDVDMTNFMLNHYLTLPKQYQDASFIKEIKAQLRTAVGNTAPNILWQENGQQKTLHLLSDSPKYLVVFWSSGCGHCLQELPKLKTFLATRNDVKVIAVGLETVQSKAEWENEIKKYPNWLHVYGKDKWRNKYAKLYGVHATPSFYLLDRKKKILAKPDDTKVLAKVLAK